MAQIDYGAIADFIEEGLNTVQSDYNVKIKLNVGEFEYQPKLGRIYHPNKPIINGTMVAGGSPLVPIKNYGIFQLTMSLSLVVYKQFTEEMFKAVQEFVTSNVAATIPLGAYMCQLNFDTPTVVGLDVRFGGGNSVVIQCYAYALLVESGVTGNDVKVTVSDGDLSEELIILKAGFGNRSVQELDNIGNDTFARNVKISQTLALNVKIPYRTTPMIKKLIEEAYSGNLDKVYTITYEDGAAFSTPKQFNMNMQDFNMSIEPGTITVIDIQFNLAFGG